jgi:hypothetical protein
VEIESDGDIGPRKSPVVKFDFDNGHVNRVQNPYENPHETIHEDDPVDSQETNGSIHESQLF